MGGFVTRVRVCVCAKDKKKATARTVVRWPPHRAAHTPTERRNERLPGTMQHSQTPHPHTVEQKHTAHTIHTLFHAVKKAEADGPEPRIVV